jgi:hypothetical protein
MSKDTNNLNIAPHQHIEGIYNAEGYDIEGYNVNGYDAEGYDIEGYDVNGYDAEGYDVDGYDNKGYNVYCYDRQGNDLLDPDNPDAQLEVTGNCIIS